MSDAIEIRPTGPIHARARPPGSKSITNRALVCAALADGTSTLTGGLYSEDTRVMIDALESLGVTTQCDWPSRVIRVIGRGGRIAPAEDPVELFVGNSGTTIRFLTPVATLGRGTIRFDGTPRMRQRPIEDLLDALRQLGADAVSEGQKGCPPVVVRAQGLAGGEAAVRGEISSQFLSGLLMAAPYAHRDVRLAVTGPLVSRPYVRMTLAVMAAFGITIEENDIEENDTGQYSVPAGRRYQPTEFTIEPDASAASYFFAAAAITGGQVTVEGLNKDSLQGDVRFCDALERMGCRVDYQADGITVIGGSLQGIDIDMNAISDTVQTLAAVALFAQGPTTIRGVSHIRHKESDRIGDLAVELRKLGADVRELPDGLQITPRPLQAALIETYDDHRMAMSMAVVGLGAPGVVIRNPQCTAKTYPDFFQDLTALSQS